MLRKLLLGSILLSIISLIVIISGMFVIFNRGIKVFEQEEIKNKETAIALFVEDVYQELNTLARAHAYWTLANEAVQNNDTEWIEVNLSKYLYEGVFGVDLLFIAKEDESIVETYGFSSTEIKNTELYYLAIVENTIANSLLWVDDQLYLMSAIPLANDDETNKNGIFIIGRALHDELLTYAKSIIVPVHSEHFFISPTDTPPEIDEHFVVFEVTSVDSDMYIYAHIENAYTNYIRDKMIGHTIAIISIMFSINVLGFLISIIISSKYRKKLIISMGMIQLSNQEFTRIPPNRIEELNLIGEKVNEMLQRIETDYLALTSKNIEIVHLLSKANELNDPYTKEHSDSVAKISEEIGRRLGYSSIDQLALSAQLHDIGKVFIPLDILNKKEKLTEEEIVLIKKHSEYGYRILQGISGFEVINKGVLYHHERYDGTGYPKRLKGDEIPLIAKIISIADVYDALTSKRPYRDAFTKEEALEIMKDKSGKHFDSKILAVFFEYIDDELQLDLNMDNQ